MVACSTKLPKCLATNSESLKIMRDCLQNVKGLRLYQMGQMAEISTTTTTTTTTGNHDADVSEMVFDFKLASSYSYRYNRSRTDHYVYSALEVLCYACGCFSWHDIGTVY